MNWFDLLKNQINVPGLSMRPMDLTNIIDEENDDDCFDDLEGFMKNVRKVMTLEDQEIKFNFKDMMTNQEACELYDGLTTIHKDKFAQSIKSAYLAESHDTIYYGNGGSFKVMLTAWWGIYPELLFRTYDEKSRKGQAFNIKVISTEVSVQDIVDQFFDTWSDMK